MAIKSPITICAVVDEVGAKLWIHASWSTVVLDATGAIVGMITDGDIRRMLEQHNSIQDLNAADLFHKKPITISSNTLAIEAFDLMKAHDISQLIVADEGQYKGMIHMHDLMKEGIL